MEVHRGNPGEAGGSDGISSSNSENHFSFNEGVIIECGAMDSIFFMSVTTCNSCIYLPVFYVKLMTDTLMSRWQKYGLPNIANS